MGFSRLQIKMTVALGHVTGTLAVSQRERLLRVSVWKALPGLETCVPVRAKAKYTNLKNHEPEAFFLHSLTKKCPKDLRNQEV